MRITIKNADKHAGIYIVRTGEKFGVLVNLVNLISYSQTFQFKSEARADADRIQPMYPNLPIVDLAPIKRGQ